MALQESTNKKRGAGKTGATPDSKGHRKEQTEEVDILSDSSGIEFQSSSSKAITADDGAPTWFKNYVMKFDSFERKVTTKLLKNVDEN